MLKASYCGYTLHEFRAYAILELIKSCKLQKRCVWRTPTACCHRRSSSQWYHPASAWSPHQCIRFHSRLDCRGPSAKGRRDLRWQWGPRGCGTKVHRGRFQKILGRKYNKSLSSLRWFDHFQIWILGMLFPPGNQWLLKTENKKERWDGINRALEISFMFAKVWGVLPLKKALAFLHNLIRISKLDRYCTAQTNH